MSGADAPKLNGGLCSVSPKTARSAYPASSARSSATRTRPCDFQISDATAQLLVEADRLCRPHLNSWLPWYASDDTVSAAWGTVLVRMCEEGQTWADYDGSEAWLMNWCRQWVYITCMREIQLEKRRAEHSPVSLYQKCNSNGTTLAEVLEEKTQLQRLREKWSNPQLRETYDALPPKMRQAIDATVMVDREPADAAPYSNVTPAWLGGTRYRGLSHIAKKITKGDVTSPVPLVAGGKAGKRKTKGNVHWLQASA